MKFVAVFVLMFGWGLCSAQNIRFQLYRTGPCTTVERLDTAYSLYKAPYSIDTNYSPKKGVVYLPHIGKYKIYFDEGPLSDTTIDIRDTGLFIFRYVEPFVALYPGGLDMPPVYASCGKRINGYFEAFYPNGRIMMRGDFIMGYPKDSLVTCYANAALKSRERVFKKETVYEKFDSLSNRVKITQSQNGPIISYRWRRSTEFFPDGRVKLKESDVNHIYKIEEYFTNGQIKIKQTRRRRIEYLENGAKKLSIRWRKKLELFEPQLKGSHDYILHKVEYDDKGQITQTEVYEIWLQMGLPPALDVGSADWIVSLKKFKDGKEVYSIRDVDAKTYKK